VWLPLAGGLSMMTKKVLYLFAFISICMPLKSYSDEANKVFIILTTPDVQTQLMAMVLTTELSKHGELEQILLCGPAGALALKNSKDVVLKPINKSPRMLLKALIEKGVNVKVCPLFLPNATLSSDALIGGVTVAKPALIAHKLLEHDVKVFTF
jgi:predicted peroxiredoxin